MNIRLEGHCTTLARPTTTAFEDLNPVIQAMVLLHLTGQTPRDMILRDEDIARAPIPTKDQAVELIIAGQPDVVLNLTHVQMQVLVDGKLVTPLNHNAIHVPPGERRVLNGP